MGVSILGEHHGDAGRVDVRMGRPGSSRRREAGCSRFWVRVLNSDTEVTLIEFLFLRFTDDGAARTPRETWFFQTGDHAPARRLGV